MKDFLKFIFLGITKTPKLELYNLKSDEKLKMPVGFNFQFLILSTFFGAPLFFKRLWEWAWLMFGVSTAQLYLLYHKVTLILSATTVEQIDIAMQSDPVSNSLTVFLIVGSVALSIKGNEWAVKRLLKTGWRFSAPELPQVQQIAKKWKISKHYLKAKSQEESL